MTTATARATTVAKGCWGCPIVQCMMMFGGNPALDIAANSDTSIGPVRNCDFDYSYGGRRDCLFLHTGRRADLSLRWSNQGCSRNTVSDTSVIVLFWHRGCVPWRHVIITWLATAKGSVYNTEHLKVDIWAPCTLLREVCGNTMYMYITVKLKNILRT